ncbi:PalH-domain-containing protein [Trichodelitschia bisporula]|uniref:PalH-domain-containing protein n=1 Tax=Trichodelitschia bisporula TaxID=703511 RepID=A0A6G1HRA2_9PEZI|nr:PalH-domain-containing protein [Trichodelitschia bisporula]
MPTPPPTTLQRRQVWLEPTQTRSARQVRLSSLGAEKEEATAAPAATVEHCTAFTLPARGFLSINPTSTLTFTSNVVFTPDCGTTGSLEAAFDGISSISDVKDPFHASVTPQAYATGAATVIAWMLVVMLLITPRTFFVGGAGGGFGLLGRRGMISGSQGSTSVIGVGSRPWLQKVAALTVAVSLTIATADTFEVAERQYATGYMNAEALRAEVVGSTEIKVSRVISDIFLWLAQVQTLIRLFPRHKEKVLIKWIGFALIILDSTFSCLNSFMGNPVGRPRRFRDAIPALSYLFQLALSMLYAAWVIYYSIAKRRYAFYHKKMWNVSLVALLSIVAVLTPVVFFITDISNASVAGWGDYFRWVGAAAASVIVWEWVERIEALEREEKKDGILGREIFDGDEMIDMTPQEVIWPRSLRSRFWSRDGWGGGGGGGGGEGGGKSTALDNEYADTTTPPRSNSQRSRLSRIPENGHDRNPRDQLATGHPVTTPPPAAVTPISRADTGSADSTVYTIRYHVAPTPAHHHRAPRLPTPAPDVRPSEQAPSNKPLPAAPADPEKAAAPAPPRGFLSMLSNPFKRKPALPPAEVRNAQVIEPVPLTNVRRQPAHSYPPWDIKGRVGAFAAEAGERWRERRERDQAEVDLPVTIIPAQPRGRTWSPEILVAPVGGSSAAGSEEAGPSARAESTAPGDAPGGLLRPPQA